jgi:type 1 glutamine amidotransferase
MLLAQMLGHRSNVVATVEGTWPEDTAFDGVDAIVLQTNGNTGHPVLQGKRMDLVQRHIDRGVGFVAIHWSVHVAGSSDQEEQFRSWLGGYYSGAISVNPVWTAAIAELPSHPTTRGVSAFELRDEWYYNMSFVPEAESVLPILQAVPPDDTRFTPDAALHPGRSETIAWAFERPLGGRSFGFTGVHYHDNWGELGVRRLIVNAILWVSGLDVPTPGAEVPLAPGDLDKNLDPK